MSITTEIQALNTNLTAAKGAVAAKGGTIGNTGLAGLASEIAGIPGGGGSSEPIVPASPDGKYVEVKSYTPTLKIESYENIDTSTTVVSFTQVGYDPFQLADINDPDFMLSSVFCESPNTGNPYNLLLRWDYSNQEFQLVFYDSTDQENVVFSFQEWDAEAYGIVFSDTSFMHDSNNHDLAYILMTQAPNYVELATISINDSTDFATFMTPDQTTWDSTEIGMGFSGVMRTQNDELVQKQFATSINFGSLASSLTSIGNGFYQGNYFLQSLYNLPSSVTTIGDYFLSNCQFFNSYFKIPSGATIGTNFLAGCTSFNQPLQVPQGVAINDYFLSNCSGFNSPLDISNTTQIGSNFLQNCRSFNQPLTLNPSATIKSGFLEGCSSFNQPFAIPSGATLSTSNSYYFMHDCNSMVSAIDVGVSSTAIGTSNYIFSTSSNSVPCYTTGITLEGTYGVEWSSKLGNRTSAPYRKLFPSILVQPASIEVWVGYTTALTVVFYPDTQPKTGTWSSSNTSIATVDQNGVVTGVSAGNATITFQTATGFSSSASITSRVTLGEVELSNGETVPLKTNSDITAICKTPDTQLKWTATINGVTFENTQVVGVSITSTSVTSLGKHFLECCENLVELELPSSITRVGDYFLRGCYSFNESLSLPNLASCGQSFMEGCKVFNQPLSLPNLTTFGANFLSGCLAFNQNFTIPAGATGTLSWAGFMYDCRNMTSTLTCNAQWGGGSSNTPLVTTNQYAPAYTTGITLAGTYAADWKTALPDLNGPSSYRKLIIA